MSRPAAKSNLRWDAAEFPGAEVAYSGGVIIAMVVILSNGTGCRWRIDGVAMKWTAMGHGDAPSMKAAKRSVERSWKKWLERASLVEAPR